MMKRKLTGISLAIMMIISAVAGCGSSSGSQEDKGEASAPSSQQASVNENKETAQAASGQEAAGDRVNLVEQIEDSNAHKGRAGSGADLRGRDKDHD